MTISQREARRLRARVHQLEARERVWRSSVPEWAGTVIATHQMTPSDIVPITVRTAARLKHAVHVTASHSGLVTYTALPHPAEP